MHKKRFSFYFTLGLLFSVTLAFSRDRLAILPVHSIGMDRQSTLTAQTILTQEISIHTKDKIIPSDIIEDALDGDDCSDFGCALRIGREIDADKVFQCTMSVLGEKVIIQYMLINVEDGKILIGDSISAESVEELDVIMKRIAISATQEKNISESAQVGNIIEGENKKFFNRRIARSYNGISFGYLYPDNGYEGVNGKSLVMEFRKGYDMEDYFVALNFSTRRGISSTVSVDYLLSKDDFCPFIGAGLGFHWVVHPEASSSDKRSDGFQFLLNTGVRAFRTYNFQILTNLSYSVTFNDYDDRAVVVTIGLLW